MAPSTMHLWNGRGAFCGADGPRDYCAIGDDEIDCPTCSAEADRLAATPEGKRALAVGHHKASLVIMLRVCR